MRKLKPLELLALSALFSIGGNADAQEAEESMPVNLHTIHVSAGFNPWTTYYAPPSFHLEVQSGVPYNFQISAAKRNKPIPDAATQARALRCVLAYSAYPMMKSGWSMHYSPLWSFKQENANLYMYPTNYSQPASVGGVYWVEVYATANTGTRVITIFQSGYDNFPRLVNSIAHEFAHSWGQGHPSATYVGNDAMRAFEADNGAKCPR